MPRKRSRPNDTGPQDNARQRHMPAANQHATTEASRRSGDSAVADPVAGREESQGGSGRQSVSRTRMLSLVAVFVVLASVFLWRGGPAQITNHLAARAIARHDLEAAKSWLQWSQQFSARDAERLLLAARIARREGDMPQMSRNLARASMWGGSADRVERERVLGRAQAGELDGIEPQINRWLTRGGHEAAEISNAYANGLAANSRFEAALRVLNAWHQDFPQDPQPLFRIGRIQEHFKQIEEARESYLAAVALDADHYPALYSLGRLLRDQKQPEKAAQYFRRCMSMPQPAAAMVGLAQCWIEMGKTEQAADLLKRVLRLDRDVIWESYQGVGERPERFIAAAELGRLEANHGNFAEAKRWLDMALQENPRDVSARYSRAIALRGLGQLQLAEAEFERVKTTKAELEKVNKLRNRINRDPGDTAARIELGKLLLEHESERSGLFWLRSVLTYDPDHPEVLRLLAEHDRAQAGQSAVDQVAESQHRPASHSPAFNSDP